MALNSESRRGVQVFPSPQEDTTNTENTGLKIENGRLTISEADLENIQAFLVRNATLIGAFFGLPAARRAISRKQPE